MLIMANIDRLKNLKIFGLEAELESKLKEAEVTLEQLKELAKFFVKTCQDLLIETLTPLTMMESEDFTNLLNDMVQYLMIIKVSEQEVLNILKDGQEKMRKKNAKFRQQRVCKIFCVTSHSAIQQNVH